MKFSDLGLSEKTLKAVQDIGYTEATPIQEKAIPEILKRNDVIGIAQTGTGKTAAFTLPMIDLLANGRAKALMPRTLILSPTRELATQIAECFQQYGKYQKLSMALLIGGESMVEQQKILSRGVDVLIATPGRMIDLCERGRILLRDVQVFVLDEADRMLDMGFIHDVTRILDKIPNRKNLGMFSATISREVMDISWVYQRDPEEITVQATKENKPDILQYRLEVPSDGKVDAIAKILAHESYDRVICFCNTKGSTERLTKFLQMRGVDAQCIHGDIPQRKREEVMQRFRDGKLRVFVATDVASRGIDVDDVDAVFNYDVPQENEYYVHRIGRTGRAKRHGVAYTLVADYPSKMRLDAIAKFTGNDVKPAHFEGDTLVVDAK